MNDLPARIWPPLALWPLLALIVPACGDPADRYAPPPLAQSASSDLELAAASPEGGGEAQGCRATEISLTATPIAKGSAVSLSGSVSSDAFGGPVLIELVALHSDSEKPVVLYHFECHGPGPFTLDAPPGLGQVHLVAFQDLEGNGPTATDAAGIAGPLIIGTAAIADITLAIAPDSDLGKFALPYAELGKPAEPPPPQGQADPPPPPPPPDLDSEGPPAGQADP
ncbi:MAG: hypothetical protein GXP62_20560 [Oligoflexia bacterium]|nr:hypothetical protein [Oligoflexia bacterium]